jgi:uncharacterized protein YsxB (DUF464 family)
VKFNNKSHVSHSKIHLLQQRICLPTFINIIKQLTQFAEKQNKKQIFQDFKLFTNIILSTIRKLLEMLMELVAIKIKKISKLNNN